MGAVLVTGSWGGDQPHVTSQQDALLHMGAFGTGNCLLKTRGYLDKPTAKDANNITIPEWDLLLQGRHIFIDAPTDVNIQSGSQGQQRRDLIVARYSMDKTTGVETVTLTALKGTPVSTGTPADPTYETGIIADGAIVADLPLCRVNLDGITITGIDTLVSVLLPISDVWDSLTQTSRWLEFGFRMQSEVSFTSFQYGGANRLLYNPVQRLIRVDLTPFKATVKVGRYQCYLPNNGKIWPSSNLGLGQAILDNGTIGREITLNTDGTVSIGPEINAGDLIRPMPNLIPVPTGVTITSTAATEV
ncbi:hypothetical protein [Bifidobacterium parmae]|uniref:Uncharacterized protein n=1 Tax=Bifidobacterium parmae TaxID=361854 RepID=A0A2N5IZY8_9BIFI|nr:hypothetical protein [Bifidobacterium parmae]PLS27526.1 hypothetical protein Uis4E_1558 [Bifidobacterium parmae]